MNSHFRPSEDFSRIIELTPTLRRRIEQTIENLVALLDSYDGDADEEPSLGWTPQGPDALQPQYMEKGPRLGPFTDDREVEDGHDEDGGDVEPLLGWSTFSPAA